MRLTVDQIQIIKSTARSVLGEAAQVTLFGSRVNDSAKGGDVDLMIEVPQVLAEPALMSARIASRVSRAMHGRRVDVLPKAPNLTEQPIHRIAYVEGVFVLMSALKSGHAFVPVLLETAKRLTDQINKLAP